MSGASVAGRAAGNWVGAPRAAGLAGCFTTERFCTRRYQLPTLISRFWDLLGANDRELWTVSTGASAALIGLITLGRLLRRRFSTAPANVDINYGPQYSKSE